MNDEIKEILNQLEIVGRKHTIEICEDGSKIETMPASVVNELRLNNYSAKILLDYITNLQKEKEDYKSRCEKANKFIKEKISSTQGVINDYMYHKEHNKILIELLQEDIEMYKKELNILNGGDEE